MKNALYVLLGAAIAGVLFALWNGALMLLLGALGNVFDAPRLCLSFWQTIPVALALAVVNDVLGRRRAL